MKYYINHFYILYFIHNTKIILLLLIYVTEIFYKNASILSIDVKCTMDMSFFIEIKNILY